MSVVKIVCRTETDMLINLASILVIKGELLGWVKFGIKYEIQIWNFGTKHEYKGETASCVADFIT